MNDLIRIRIPKSHCATTDHGRSGANQWRRLNDFNSKVMTMPDGPQSLEIAQFKLDAFAKIVQLRIDLMKAYADYNYRMMEVLQLRVRIETDMLKLRVMQDAFQDYRIARRSLVRLLRSLESKQERFLDSSNRISYLLMGETVPSYYLTLGWRGYWFIVSQASVKTVIDLTDVKCKASDRAGANFFSPSNPDADISSAPSEIKRALHLLDWARRHRYVPRLGSGPYELLAELLTILSASAEEALQSNELGIEEAKTDLQRVREMNWRNIQIEEEEPKTTESTPPTVS